MMSVTAPGQHSMNGSLSFSQDQTLRLDQPFELPLNNTPSSRSPFFPPEPAAQTGPLPNPPFVFPARQSLSSAPSFPRTTGRRPASFAADSPPTPVDVNSSHGSRKSRPPPLPSFSFNPSDSIDDSKVKLPASPVTPNGLSVGRAGGHRRGGSEFIGGDGATGLGLGLMSTSPTNGDGVLPSPTGSKLGPSAGRRGHAHRRSAAISCHDLSFMLKAPAANADVLRGGSAPSSPSETNRSQSSFLASIDTTASPSLGSNTIDSGRYSPGKAFNKARVGFSDTLEYIPRPVSMVSSDTSSITTVRPGHSVSGSLSSIVSSGTSSPPVREPYGVSTTKSSTAGAQARPRTAGAILSKTKEDSLRPEMPPLPHSKSTPVSTISSVNGSPLTPKFPRGKYLFFGQESPSGEKSPARSETSLQTSSLHESTTSHASSSTYVGSMDLPGHLQRVPSTASRRSSVSRASVKKQKKVRSWAGSILGRKSRSRCQKPKPMSRRSPTPPSRSYTPVFNEAQNASNTISSIAEETPSRPQVATDFANWKPRHVTVPDDDSMSPIIDLDAALGPFNTPSNHDPAWEASQRNSGPTKRRMHSALKMSAFSGPGMHYHRRAESAPEMAAFDYPRSGLHRLGSSSTMADVFEEDEEDDWVDTKSLSAADAKGDSDSEDEASLNTGIQVVDADDMQNGKTMNWNVDEKQSNRSLNRKSSGLSDESAKQTGSSMKSERSTLSLRETTIPEEPANAVEIADDDHYPPTPGSDAKASDSTLTPPLRPVVIKELAPVNTFGPVFLAPSYGTPTTPQSTERSPFPSPRSPMSYDTQPISTAPSSVTDERSFQSLLFGEPGPEVRMSVDDVPSLTSSESTTTSGHTFATAGQFRDGQFRDGQFRDGQRSASLSSAAMNHKRSSIVSLSRLISSSHGEKSKLSIDSRPPGTPDSSDKSSRHGKGKRLSRMMQFWRPRNASP